MIGHTLASYVMMKLGTFSFGISTAAYQNLKRSTEFRWGAQERFGQLDALQFTGPGAETIALDGVIFPEYRGGLGQLDELRTLGGTGQPQLLVSGRGATMGRWVIEGVDEGQSIFAAAGVPRRQEFTVKLRKYDGGESASLIDTSGMLLRTPAQTGVLGAQSDLGRLANTAVALATGRITSLNSAISVLRTNQASMGPVSGGVIANATRAVGAFYSLQSAGTNMNRLLPSITSLDQVPGVTNEFMSANSSCVNASSYAATSARNAGLTLAPQAGQAGNAVIMRDSGITFGQAAIAAAELYGATQSLIARYAA